MKVRNVTKKEMVKALGMANKWFAGNLTFAHLSEGRFTLGVHETEGPGGRLGRTKKDGTRRRVPHKACWHAHGKFFEALFSVQPRAEVDSKVSEIRGARAVDGNWQDHPTLEAGVWFSDLCECAEKHIRGLLIPQRPPKGRKERLIKMSRSPMRPEGLLREVTL